MSPDELHFDPINAFCFVLEGKENIRSKASSIYLMQKGSLERSEDTH
jgi:hypothetical protein